MASRRLRADFLQASHGHPTRLPSTRSGTVAHCGNSQITEEHLFYDLVGFMEQIDLRGWSDDWERGAERPTISESHWRRPGAA